jgi:hypothetical protein
MSTPNSVERFHFNAKSLFSFILELVENAHTDGFKIIHPSLIKFAGIVLFNLDKNIFLKKFIEKSYQHWEKIYIRDTDFFINSAGEIFLNLPLENVNAFKELFLLKTEDGEYYITEDDKDALWDYFESLVRISIIYMTEDNKRNCVNADLEMLCNKWNIKK